MKTNLFVLLAVLGIVWVTNSGFFPNDDSPRWSPDPKTRINSGVVFQEYTPLPYNDNNIPVVNEPQYLQTPQGVFIVNSQFRVHPITAVTAHQTEVPITRHPTNQLIMFGSANTSRGGNFSTGWYVTTDGGTTWNGNDTLFNTAGGPVFNFGDPGPIIDGSGRFLNSYITLTGQMGASFSINNGTNWSNTVTFPGSTTSSDKNFSSTDDVPSSAFFNRSYTVYTEFAGAFTNRIVGTFTANQGVSWSNVAPVSPPPSVNHFHQGADSKVGPNGEVYVVWTNGILTSPFTEDSLGFARSNNGGVTWAISKNNAANVNGNRTFNMMNGIRVAGFPRIDVDRTCGTRAGWIYVTVGEKNPGVAGDISDIILYRSTDGGTTFSSGVRVNQDAFANGRKQYMAAVRVDESGGVNVVYYDTRNTPTNDSAEVYLSRSTDGGVTFTDLKVGSKFRHAPTGVPGVNSQYAGDYIGITSALIDGNPVNGNQRIWPYWMANNTPQGTYQAHTAKVELLPSNPCLGCQDFTTTAFTPGYFNLEYSGTQFWTRQAVSAYGVGTGSAKYNFLNDNVRTPQSLVTSFEPVPAGHYLTFDEAYAPYNAGFPGPDTLVVESSINGGASYTVRAVLLGKYPNGGELNTAPATTSSFVPTSSQWASKIYQLPVGTNKVRLRAESGYGNNLYLDNICIKALPNAAAGSLCAMPEGFYRSLPTPNVIQDTIRAYLVRTDFPNIKVDSAIAYSTTFGCFSTTFSKAQSGSYYVAFKQRNSIETWVSPQTYSRGSGLTFDIINNNGIVFGNNQKFISPYYGMFSGDVNYDNVIDVTDLVTIYNDVLVFNSGYIVTDINGDNFADASDLIICYNNAINFVQRMAPPGAFTFTPSEINNDQPVFNNDAERQKYELSKQMMNNAPQSVDQNSDLEKSEVYQMMKRIIEENSKTVKKSTDPEVSNPGRHGVGN